ncbi:MAG: alkaline phosphatase family protein [Chloroflexi bacterium]|nr:alkaline phosphatase family protein [Chloroflexota bacterium]
MPSWAVSPAYDGRGFANVPNTVLRHFGLPSPLPPLATEMLDPDLLHGSRAIVLLLLDACGYELLTNALDRGVCPHLARRLRAGTASLSALTSIFPSTTAAALTTLATGHAPGQHGIGGYTLWCPQQATVMNMITFRAIDGSNRSVDPAALLDVPTVFQRLTSVGVRSVYANLRRYLGSGLSVMHSVGAQLARYHTFADLCVTLRDLLEIDGSPAYVQVYWDTLDNLQHTYGPVAEALDAELAAIDFLLERELFSRVKRPDVLFLVLADHGQCATTEERAVWLQRDRALLDLFEHPPAGERRVPYLYPREGKVDEVRAWFRAEAPESVMLLTAQQVEALELWGPGPLAPVARQRFGTLVGLATPGWQLPYRAARDGTDDVLPTGAHGNLTRLEALVPLVALRLM